MPADRPLVVRTDPLRFWRWIGGAALGCYLVACAVLGGVLFALASSLRMSPALTALITGSPLVVFLVMVAVPVLVVRGRLVGDGPLLAADHAGVWVRPLRLGSQVAWLPWRAVAAVYVTRKGFEDLVVLDPDPRAGVVPLGTRLTVTTLMSDHTAGEIIAGMVSLSGGRVPVDQRAG